MTQTITIEYLPLLSGNVFHRRDMKVSLDELFGIMIMANVVTSPNMITIRLSNGDVVDITQIHTLPYLTQTFDYVYKLGELNVSSNELELIQGATQLCILFGVDPSSLITDVKHRGISINIDIGKYFGNLSIYNFTEYPDGSTIHLDNIKQIISPRLVDSLMKNLAECFPGTEAGITIPSEIYMISSNMERDDIIACVYVSPYSPESIGAYTDIGAYYVYNVCADINYRGQGLAKSIMITMLNDLYSRGQTRFILEVLDSNTVAYTLYTSLGFKKISSSYEEDKTYDILYLTI